jgi:hypothetical protein
MRSILVLLALSFVLGSTSCKKDEGTLVASGVSIEFRTDSGYTYTGDTVPQEDTLRFGAIITEGEDPLARVFLSVSYDSAAAIWQDTLNVDANPFTFEAVHITRAEAGTEQVIFTAEENDGDRTTRRLTFIVP